MGAIQFEVKLCLLDHTIRTSEYPSEIRRAERNRYALWCQHYGTAQ